MLRSYLLAARPKTLELGGTEGCGDPHPLDLPRFVEARHEARRMGVADAPARGHDPSSTRHEEGPHEAALSFARGRRAIGQEDRDMRPTRGRFAGQRFLQRAADVGASLCDYVLDELLSGRLLVCRLFD